RIYALDLDVGVFFVLALSSIGVIGVLMAGWASANKFSLIGALPAAAPLIADELPLPLAAAPVALQAGPLVRPFAPPASPGRRRPVVSSSPRGTWRGSCSSGRPRPRSPGARRSTCRSRTRRSSSGRTPSTRG